MPFALWALAVLSAAGAADSPSAEPPAKLSDHRGPSAAARVEVAPAGRTRRPLQVGLHCVPQEKTGLPVVDAVVDESLADRARVRPGDVVTEFNGTVVTSVDQLVALVRATDRYAKAEITVRRGDAVLAKTLSDGLPDLVVPAVPNHPAKPGKTVETFRLAVAGIDFADVAHNPDWKEKHWNDLLFNQGTYTGKSPSGEPAAGSAADWFAEQSAGKFKLTGKFLGWYPFPEKKDILAGRNAMDSDWHLRAVELVRKEANNDLSDFDGICLLTAGPLAGKPGALLWPQQGHVRVGGRNLPFILAPEDGRTFPNISIACHEIGHLLGLPDQYGIGGADNLGLWCTMALGHKGGPGTAGIRPNHLCAWCKMRLGWLKPAPLDPAVRQHLVLKPVENSAEEAFQILLQPDGSEYLLLENRAKIGFDAELPATGMLVWRVTDFSKLELEAADGLHNAELARRLPQHAPFPQTRRNALTPFTVPGGQARNPNGRGVFLTNIRKHPEGEITFGIGFEFF